MPKVTFKQCDVQRAIRAAQACGLTVTGTIIAPNGEIRVLTGDAATPQVEPPSAYDLWKEQQQRGDRAA